MPPPPPPPAEWVGKARALRAEVAAEDGPATRAIEALVKPLHQRAARHPVPRAADLIDAGRAWRETLPTGARLALNVTVTRRELVIDELRISSVGFRFESWSSPDFEPGLAAILVRLRVAPHTCEIEAPIVGCVSLHALARRFQRGLDISRAAILGDVAALASAPAGNAWELTVASGRWAGVTASLMNGSQTLRTPTARTFF